MNELLSGLAISFGWALAFSCGFFASLIWLTPASLTITGDRLYWSSAVVGTLHAAFTSFSSVWLLYTGTLPAWDDFGSDCPAWAFVVQVSFGFYMYDTILTLYCTKLPGRGAMLFHHFLSLFSHFYPVCVERKFAAVSAFGYLSEVRHLPKIALVIHKCTVHCSF